MRVRAEDVSAPPHPKKNDQMEVHIFQISPCSQLPAALWINVAGRRCSHIGQESGWVWGVISISDIWTGDLERLPKHAETYWSF